MHLLIVEDEEKLAKALKKVGDILDDRSGRSGVGYKGRVAQIGES
jgi:hypothetical protein